MKTYTLGFTQKNAEKFFSLIRQSGVKQLLDVRLHNNSQLAGFTKRDDLRFFLRELCQVDYHYVTELAPTKQILTPYKKGEMSWDVYEDRYMDLMAQRRVERSVTPEQLHGGCLLCSEHQPHHCHRRLAVEYLNRTLDLNLEVIHLV
ncbi:DUF488 domain-containing protein [Ectothiorhodospiraceae bacterium BW-2]|nr:DUF488 domain-containing protein [Ectothiorhodospiraceae bacterium BW-2]